jgi:hypothetical protein
VGTGEGGLTSQIRIARRPPIHLWAVAIVRRLQKANRMGLFGKKFDTPAAPKPAVAGIRRAAAVAGETLTIRDPAVLQAVRQAAEAGCGLDDTPRVSSWLKRHRDLRSSRMSDRYGEFVGRGKSAGLHENEQLVPLLTVPHGPCAAEQWADRQGDVDRAHTLLALVPPREWGYFMPLAPGLGTLGAVEQLSGGALLSKHRSLLRLNFIMGGLAKLCGGSLQGRSVLDMACNWGAFAVEAALWGATDVEGFDIRRQNVERARRLADYFLLPLARFSECDVFDFEPGRRYDIVLNLGLMYHITKPFELVRRSYELCNQVAVIDTVVHREPFSGFILGTGEHAPDHAATAIGCELHPTYRALIDLAYLVGFKEVVELQGSPPAAWSDFASDPYGSGNRRCIVAFK